MVRFLNAIQKPDILVQELDKNIRKPEIFVGFSNGNGP